MEEVVVSQLATLHVIVKGFWRFGILFLSNMIENRMGLLILFPKKILILEWDLNGWRRSFRTQKQILKLMNSKKL